MVVKLGEKEIEQEPKAMQLCTLRTMIVFLHGVARPYCRGSRYELPVRFGTTLNQV